MFGLESLFAIAVFGSEFIKEQRSKKNSLNSNSWNNLRNRSYVGCYTSFLF